MATRASNRLEFRLRQESRERIEHAAKLVDESASDFVRTAAEHRAEEVLLERDAVTLVPAAFFDQLISALDEKPQPSQALVSAGNRARRVVSQ